MDKSMSRSLIITGGRIVDPSRGIDGIGDIFIEDGKIKEIRLLKANDGASPDGEAYRSEVRTIDAGGKVIIPGLVDMHVHLREPGFEHKETIRTGTRAAVKGGITSVCPMPNTLPVNDNPTVTAFIIRKSFAEGACSVYPIGAVTKGQRGDELAEMGLMYEAGCVAFSDDGRPVMSSIMMRRALEYSKIFRVPIISHCEDLTLTDDGVMNEGKISATLGLKGIPAAAEDIMVARDILLAELTGGRLHIAHVSTRGSVRLIRQAKERGIMVTAETCPHYFSITDEAVRGYNTNAKVNPPLRTQLDVEAVKEGLRDGTIDVIATDHAPHHRDEKMKEFDKAPSGISGFETSLSLSLALVRDGILTLPQLVEKTAATPARIMGIGKGTLAEGADADIVIVDTEKKFKVSAEEFISKGRNTPFDGWSLKGAPLITVVGGIVYE